MFLRTRRRGFRYCFVGKVMGIAMRQGMPQQFNVPSIVWKLLVGEDLHRGDLRRIDQHLIEFNDRLIAAPRMEEEEVRPGQTNG